MRIIIMIESGVHFQVRDSACRSTTRTDDLLKMKEIKIIKHMLKQGHLHKQIRCYHCTKGELGPLRARKATYSQRCSRKACQKFTYPHQGDPIFIVGCGAIRSVGEGRSATPKRIKDN